MWDAIGIRYSVRPCLRLSSNDRRPLLQLSHFFPTIDWTTKWPCSAASRPQNTSTHGRSREYVGGTGLLQFNVMTLATAALYYLTYCRLYPASVRSSSWTLWSVNLEAFFRVFWWGRTNFILWPFRQKRKRARNLQISLVGWNVCAAGCWLFCCLCLAIETASSPSVCLIKYLLTEKICKHFQPCSVR